MEEERKSGWKDIYLLIYNENRKVYTKIKAKEKQTEK